MFSLRNVNPINLLKHSNGPSSNARRSLANVAAAAGKRSGIQLNDVVHGFQLRELQPVPEYNMTALQFQHLKTGAKYVHLQSDDSNNVFSVTFKTPPLDSTGVPHILEHTTLCGSTKYPVRDPFFNMLNRSLSTFMNALTANDYTMYPFSTENQKDYYNLMSVYTDAVFSPLLNELDFKQEGWRLEHENPKDSSTPIIFKGVVYNEMKGALSDPSQLFVSRLQQRLYPGTTYSTVSGGDPENITDLTHSALVDFHTRHYHPSNALFYTYGNFDVVEHLKRIDERVRDIQPLSKQPNPLGSIVPFDKPQHVVEKCPPDPMGNPEKQTKVSVTYLTNEDRDVQESFAIRVLTSLLIEGAASPMYKALIETNIGSDYAASVGYDNGAWQTSVSFGLQGIRPDDVELVQRKIKEVLETVAKDGFDPQRVETVVHQIELGMRHRVPNFGLNAGFNVSRVWAHDGDVLESLRTAQQIQRFREDYRREGNKYFRDRIQRYFLDNSHVLVFVMEPSTDYLNTLAESEGRRLNTHVSSLTDNAKQKVFEDGERLIKEQETKKDLSVLPTLETSDIAKEGKSYPVELIPVGSASSHATHAPTTQWRSTNTNGVSYITLDSSAFSSLPRDLLMYVPLFCSALTSLGTKTKSLAELDEEIRRLTGGVSASSYESIRPDSLFSGGRTHFAVSTSCIHSLGASDGVDAERLAQVYDLLREVLTETAWDGPEVEERLTTVLVGLASNGMNSVVHSGHSFAMVAAQAAEKFGPTPYAVNEELTSGLTQIGFVNNLASGEINIPDIIQKLKLIAAQLLGNKSDMRFMVNAIDSVKSVHMSELQRLSNVLNLSNSGRLGGSNSDAPAISTRTSQNSYSLFPLPIQVNYTARAFLTVPYTHPDVAPLSLLSSMMTSQFLHRELREKGGAYGGGARLSPMGGTLSMFSYRDPPSGMSRTLETYDRAIDWACGIKQHVNEKTLSEAKLSWFSKMDSPVAASAEGSALFQHGVSDEMKQRRRQEVLAVTLDAVQDVAHKYLAGSGVTSSVAVLAAEESIKSIDGMKEEWEVRRL
ncbi:Metalloenzyme, LuxS/M16 peptidase-like protein [Cladochytrium replicatum]|nr:Metalloenzyme, LuxS/M16 peptidase-like protein [Cladochytrium replicatum]